MTSCNVVSVVGVVWALCSTGCTASQTQSTASVATPAPTTAASASTPTTEPIAAGSWNAARQAGPASCPSPGAEGAVVEPHSGVITYSEAPKTKSADAYQHVDFWLQTSQRKLALAPSPSVTWDALNAERDRQLDVCCIWRAPEPPAPHESAPLGPDGQPLPRPSRCEVVSFSQRQPR